VAHNPKAQRKIQEYAGIRDRTRGAQAWGERLNQRATRLGGEALSNQKFDEARFIDKNCEKSGVGLKPTWTRAPKRNHGLYR
jgi:hypothetical protein